MKRRTNQKRKGKRNIWKIHKSKENKIRNHTHTKKNIILKIHTHTELSQSLLPKATKQKIRPPTYTLAPQNELKYSWRVASSFQTRAWKVCGLSMRTLQPLL